MRRLLVTLVGLAAAMAAIAGDVISTGQPDEAQIAEYAAQGVVAVIDLRTASENRGIDEQAVVEDSGMDYVSLPIGGRQAINFENAKALDDLLTQRDGPVVVHCGSGNRVGALMALRASLNGASDEEALAVGEEYGMTRLKGIVEQVLEQDAP